MGYASKSTVFDGICSFVLLLWLLFCTVNLLSIERYNITSHKRHKQNKCGKKMAKVFWSSKGSVGLI